MKLCMPGKEHLEKHYADLSSKVTGKFSAGVNEIIAILRRFGRVHELRLNLRHGLGRPQRRQDGTNDAWRDQSPGFPPWLHPRRLLHPGKLEPFYPSTHPLTPRSAETSATVPTPSSPPTTKSPFGSSPRNSCPTTLAPLSGSTNNFAQQNCSSKLKEPAASKKTRKITTTPEL